MNLKKFFERKEIFDIKSIIKKSNSIAIITTTNEKHLESTIEQIKVFNNNFRLTFISQSDNIEFLRERFKNALIISSPRKGFFGISINKELIKEIFNKPFDLLIILYRNEDGTKHKRAELISLLTNSKIILGYDFFNKWYQIPRRYIIYNLIKPIFEIKIFKIIRALFYNITFGIFLIFLRLFELLEKLIRKKSIYEEE